MKLWLASYPRSGNTLTRMILNECFGIKSTSVYLEENLALPTDQWLADRIGYWGDLHLIDSSPEWVAVKTHGLPTDDAPAIYIIRDGRAAFVSYAQWLAASAGARPAYPELIRGDVWPGSWTDHFHAWNAAVRKHTLLLRYEDLTLRQNETIATIGRFLDIQQKAPFTADFGELRSMYPTMFWRGSNQMNVADLGKHEKLFRRLHGHTMQRLGYGNPPLVQRIGGSVRRAYRTAATIVSATS